MGHLLSSSVSTVRGSTRAPITGLASPVSAQSLAITRADGLKGLSTNASTVTTSLWRDLTTAQIGVFAVGSAFWKTVFNLPLKECENCGGMFTATRSATATRGDGRRLYCSKKCYAEGSRRFEEKPCAHCGAMFYPRSAKHDATQRTCSTKCMAEFFSGANSHGFKGGVHLQKASNHKFVLIGKREGYVSKYTAQHRLVCAKQIGRMLKRSEIVIHINSDGLDNRPSNLFLCESMSEFSRRRQGSLPWPKKSNLKEYKEKNT
jgi:hypothetical protein